MNLRRLVKALLFPHIAIAILILPIAAAFLVYSMVVLGTESIIAICSYVLAAYTLTVWCIRIPYLIRYFKAFKEENKYARRWREDDRLRINSSLFGSLLWNTAYGIFQLWLGYVHHTFWFYSLAGYYISLAVMRFFLALHTRKYQPGEQMRSELKKYCACGWVFLIMNLALTLMIFFMVYWNRTFLHHEITTIMMATYTFSSFTFAIINVIKYRKYQSPVYSASKAISFAAACVSMLTLSSTMLTTFDDGTMTLFHRKLMLGLIGAAVSAIIVTMAIFMIVKGNTALKELKKQNFPSTVQNHKENEYGNQKQ